jgi:hypothetical protein
MSGLMRRLTRGRAATDDEIAPPASGASDPVGAGASHAHDEGGSPEAATIVAEPDATGERPAGEAGGTPAGEAGGTAAGATTEAGGAAARERDVPAGLDAGELAAVTAGSARRGRLRRRLHYLRHARELLLRDLGGFYYEAHRSEGGPDAHRRLLDVKARRLATLDLEVRELEERLSEPHAQAVVREPGIGGTCRECGELHGSEARFCPRCGTPLTRRGARRHEPGAAEPAYEEQGRPTTASLWGRRHTPETPPPPQATQAADESAKGEPESAAATRGDDEAGRTGDESGTSAGDEAAAPVAAPQGTEEGRP